MFKGAINTYKDRFSEYGCEFNYGLLWRDDNGEVCEERPPVTDKYECTFWYNVTKDGQLICYDKSNGYTLGFDFVIVRIMKKLRFLRPPIELVECVDDNENEIDELLEDDYHILKELYGK